MNLEVRNISKKFNNKTILSDVSLKFETNNVYGLLGLNGIGKTTLIKCIFNELKINSGEILIDNNKISSDNYKKMYYFPENDDIPKNISIYEYLLKIYLLSGQNKNNFQQQLVHKAVNLKNINLKKTKLGSLSSGQKKIVSLIACLLINPDIIVFDEPTANLDIANKEIVLQMIKSLKSKDRIIVIVTHLIEEIKSEIDYAIILTEQGIVFNDKVKKRDIKKIYLEKINFDKDKLYL